MEKNLQTKKKNSFFKLLIPPLRNKKDVTKKQENFRICGAGLARAVAFYVQQASF